MEYRRHRVGQIEAVALRPTLGAERIRRIDPHDLLGGGIEENEAPGLVGDDDAVAHAVENRLQDPRLLLQRVLRSGKLGGALLGRGAALGDPLFERDVERFQLLLRPHTLGDLLLQLDGARPERIVRALQRRVALLQLGQHAVEPVDQRTDLVVLRLVDADVKVLLPRDRPHGLLERQNRFRDHPLQSRGEQKRDDGGANHEDSDDARVADEPGAQLLHAGFDVDGAERLAVKRDGMKDLERLPIETVTARFGLRRQ